MANQAEAIQAWNKYISPEFDPSLLKKDKRQGQRGARHVRMVTPFKCACLKCGAIIPHMKKFNTRIEKAVDKDYHGVVIFRFFYRCPECSQPFTIVTDPATNDYAAEHGVRRIMEVWKEKQLAQKKEEAEKAAKDELGGADTMEALEERTERSKRLMEQHEELEALKSSNREIEGMTPDELLRSLYGSGGEAAKAGGGDDDAVAARTAEEDAELAAAFGGSGSGKATGGLSLPGQSSSSLSSVAAAAAGSQAPSSSSTVPSLPPSASVGASSGSAATATAAASGTGFDFFGEPEAASASPGARASSQSASQGVPNGEQPDSGGVPPVAPGPPAAAWSGGLPGVASASGGVIIRRKRKRGEGSSGAQPASSDGLRLGSPGGGPAPQTDCGAGLNKRARVEESESVLPAKPPTRVSGNTQYSSGSVQQKKASVLLAAYAESSDEEDEDAGD